MEENSRQQGWSRGLNEITLILINIFILFPNMKTKYTFMISIGLLGEREKQENRQFKFSQNRE